MEEAPKVSSPKHERRVIIEEIMAPSSKNNREKGPIEKDHLPFFIDNQEKHLQNLSIKLFD
jgi:hypothetical protein